MPAPRTARPMAGCTGFQNSRHRRRKRCASQPRFQPRLLYATGAIAILRPLVDAGLIPSDYPLSLPSVSGYSGGGRTMIEAYEAEAPRPYRRMRWACRTSTSRRSQRYTESRAARCSSPPCNFRQGMLVAVASASGPDCPAAPRPATCTTRWPSHWPHQHAEWVSVLPPTDDLKLAADT